MFRRIVSNLSFSPALVGQLGFYAKRLRKEEATRRLGLVFTALALVVQSLAVFSPPEAANATTPGQVGNANRCDVESVNPRGQAFEIVGNEAKVQFDVKGGKNCKVQVSANSFYAPSMDGTPYDKQVLHERKTEIYTGPGRHSLKTSLPAKSTPAQGCFYQVDLTYGTFNVTPVIGYGHGKLDCPTAVVASATCTSMNIIRSADPKKVTLRATASTTNAQVTKFTFDITKPDKSKDQKTVTTNEKLVLVDYDAPAVGTYEVKATVHTTVGQDSENCRGTFTVEGPATPTAICTGAAATITNRTQAYFSGSAAVSGGATVRSYTFVVKNANGIEVTRTVVPSSAMTANSGAVNIPAQGNYTVELYVQTSLGDQSGAACVKPFTIAPPNVCPYNPTLPPNSPDCQPCPDNPDIWVKDERCKAVLINTKTATNMTQGMVEASTVTARAGDKLTYTITVENKGLVSESVTMQEDLKDVLEYATVVDQGGGTLNDQSKILTWPAVTVAAGKKQSRTIAVQMMSTIPNTNTGTGVATSYDCKIMNTFGNTITVNVDCPPEKVVVERVVGELPQTGPRENMIFAALLLSVVVYFYARSKQLGREVRLIRRNLNTGTI